MTGEPLPQVSPTAVVADFDTELVVLVPEHRKVHLLEADAAVLFDSCRRGDDVETLVAELAAATGRDHANVAVWVQDALAELTRNHLLAGLL